MSVKGEIELSGVPDEVNDILSRFQRLSAITQLVSKINDLKRWVNKRCGIVISGCVVGYAPKNIISMVGIEDHL